MNDVINSGFEAVAAVLLWLNVVQIRKDRILRGMHWAPVIVFTAWGCWNLYYYASIGHWWSWVAAGAVLVVNGVWLFHLWLYRGGR